ncbi:MAG: hypothetical protein KC656_10120 [Myxococcales bacterium]|nr:hypothetical protein [Myxococcales bacterium]
MLKATTKTLVLAFSLATFGTGCDLADLVNGIIGGNGDDPVIVDPGDPTDPPEPCFDADGDGICDPDPWTTCEEQLDICLNAGWDEPQPANGTSTRDIAMPYPGDDDCWTQYDECVGYEPPPPPPYPYEQCDIELQDCLNAVYTDDDGQSEPQPGADMAMPWYPGEEECWTQYDACIGQVEPPPPPPIDTCEWELEECLMTSFNPEACFQAYDVCIGYPPPPPMGQCDELYGMCLMNGVDPWLCDEVYVQCIDNQDHPCDDEPGYPEDPEPMPFPAGQPTP